VRPSSGGRVPRGTAVFNELAGTLDRADVWISSHHGGHRFAANVLVFPLGLHLGRLDPADARRVVSQAVDGRIELAHYRGRTCYEPQVQAAEHAVRAVAGLTHVEDLSLGGIDGAVVRFASRDGSEQAVAVEEIEGPSVPASCGAEPESQRTFATRLV
jgi:hypothetical protein